MVCDRNIYVAIGTFASFCSYINVPFAAKNVPLSPLDHHSSSSVTDCHRLSQSNQSRRPKRFFSPHDIVSSSSSSPLFFDALPSLLPCRIADKEQRLGVESGSIRIDEGSLKIVGWIGE
eukprot:scaffold47404_cov71-Cyclotella_meneghiniana.AAC.3